MIKKKSRCVIEKQSVPEFHEDFIEEVPTCLESYFLDDNMEEDNFSDEITYNDSSDDEVTSEEKEVVVMCISPQGITVVEEIACEAVHRTDGSGASEFMSAVVSQEEYEEDMVITPNPLSEPQRESGMSIPTEQVQRESPGCAEWPSDITPVCPSGPAHTIEDEILSIFADRAIIAAASDASSSVLTPLEDVRLSEIPVAVRSPVRSPVIPVSEATHYFSQYLEVRFTLLGRCIEHALQTVKTSTISHVCLNTSRMLSSSGRDTFSAFLAVRHGQLRHPSTPLRYISAYSHPHVPTYTPFTNPLIPLD